VVDHYTNQTWQGQGDDQNGHTKHTRHAEDGVQEPDTNGHFQRAMPDDKQEFAAASDIALEPNDPERPCYGTVTGKLQSVSCDLGLYVTWSDVTLSRLGPVTETLQGLSSFRVSYVKIGCTTNVY